MAIKSDYHLHSNNSGDSKASMEDMILKGIDLGLTSMCFTEHQDIDFKYEDPSEEGMFDLNTDSYLYELLKMRSKYEDKINILFGVEIGAQKHLRRELAIYSKSYDFDFIISSLHLLDGHDPYNKECFKDVDDETLYRNYFREISENLKVFSNFDVLGHLDYIVRYGKNMDKEYSYDKYKDVIDPILEKIIDMGKGIEINTGAVGYGLKELNPCTDIIKKYHELGGEIITIGSDAHSPERISDSFGRAEEILLDCGFKYYTTFEKRIAEYHKLG